MHLNRPETIPSPSVRGEIVFHKTGPWCQKGWGPPLLTGGLYYCGGEEFEYHSLLTNTLFHQDFLYIIIFSEMLPLEQWYILLPFIILKKQV